jgi:hypothetical protein
VSTCRSVSVRRSTIVAGRVPSSTVTPSSRSARSKDAVDNPEIDLQLLRNAVGGTKLDRGETVVRSCRRVCRYRVSHPFRGFPATGPGRRVHGNAFFSQPDVANRGLRAICDAPFPGISAPATSRTCVAGRLSRAGGASCAPISGASRPCASLFRLKTRLSGSTTSFHD